MGSFTHFNDEGRAKMVDVSAKEQTLRTATAAATVFLNAETYAMVVEGRMKKGDVLAVAQVAGIMAAKRCPDVIPMCHPIALTGADISFELDGERHTIKILATTRCKGETGVEMEALTAASVAALTVYDMCKAVDRAMTVEQIKLVSKTGGKTVYHA
jgi:cyclic pyranopterin phosphate synthase